MTTKTVSGMSGFLFLAVLLLAATAGAARAEEKVAGYPAAEALRLGEAIYQRGVLPSGEPVRALVQLDLEVTGTMTTCSNCHMRSGLGSAEGGIFTPPTSGAKLYAPLTGQQDIPGPNMNRSMYQTPPRPAYDDATLARALSVGSDPNGRTFSPTMPRYQLDDDALKLLMHYIKQLSSTYSPGVTDSEIRFATVVTDRVAPRQRDAMLLPLQAFFRQEWNERLAVLGSQWNARWFGSGTGKIKAERTYRPAVLDVWQLKGAPESWPAQLEEFYRKKPVFALVGGMAPGNWAPVHRFCEDNKVPCIFPLTDLPTISAGDRHTLYFSKGYYQEGEAAAKFLSRVFELPKDKEVLQVYREDERGLALARGFAESWRTLGSSALTERPLAASVRTGKAFWEKLRREHPDAVLLLWLAPDDLAGMEALAAPAGGPSTVFVSSGMLAGSYKTVPDQLRDVTFMTYPERLPGEGEYTRSLVTAWLKIKKLPVDDLEISARTYFLTRLLASTLIDMGTDFYRDFFLDILDCEPDQVNSSLSYPLLSFGPGQRYAAKGCYVVTLTKGEHPQLVKQSDWVIY